jgi:hypothetical protein
VSVIERTFMGGGSGGSPGNRIEVSPEEFGARCDGVALDDVAITASTSTLAATGASFTSADVGKTIAVYGAGVIGNGFAHVTTIQAVTSSTQVTLAANASTTVSGSRAVYGTDDSAAIEAALDEIVDRGIADRIYCGRLWCSDGIYMLTRASQMGAPYYSNGQVRLKPIPELDVKFDLGIKSGATGGTFGHWNQSLPQKSGTVFYSTLVGGSSDGTWGPPSIISGPSNSTQGGGFTAGFSNMLLTVDGLQIVAQRNPCVTALQVGKIGQLYIKSLGVVADMTPAEMNAAALTNDLGLGVRVPAIGNNHFVKIDRLAIEGFYYGCTLADHFTADTLVVVYANTALFVLGGGAMEHGVSIQNLGVEAAQTVLEGIFSVDGRFPITIDQCNIETSAGTNFKDVNNAMVGTIYFTNNTGAAPTVSGCKNLKIIDLNRYPGAVSVVNTPVLPATTVAYKNPFWHDATVYVTGGTVTVIAVDGVTLGVTSGAIDLPSGREITLTYSVAPTWRWVLK